MYVKIITEEGEQIFPCSRICYQGDWVTIEREKEPTMTIRKYEDYKRLVIYIMNDNGKTIDKKIYNQEEQVE